MNGVLGCYSAEMVPVGARTGLRTARIPIFNMRSRLHWGRCVDAVGGGEGGDVGILGGVL